MKITLVGDQVALSIEGTYSADELLKILHFISQARAKVAGDQFSNIKVHIDAAVNPRWLTGVSPIGVHSLLFLHPGFGWQGMTLETPEVAKLAAQLQKQIADVSASKETTVTDAAIELPTHGNGESIH